MRDRLDLWVPMPRIAPADYVRSATPEDTATVAGRVAAARERQLARAGRLNARLSGRVLRTACALNPAAEARAIDLAELEGFSARGTERLMRVARTIADLAGDGRVGEEHLVEAARFRSPRSEGFGRGGENRNLVLPRGAAPRQPSRPRRPAATTTAAATTTTTTTPAAPAAAEAIG